MFYCAACRDKNKWPESGFKSYGKCEVCGTNAECSDIPAKYLPAREEKLFTNYTFCPRDPYGETSKEKHVKHMLVHVTIPGEGERCVFAEIAKDLPEGTVFH